MEMTQEIKQIAVALLQAQKDMGTAKKDSKNPFFKSSYADLNSIREACIPVLNANGISVLQPIVIKNDKSYVETVLLHTSGELLVSQIEIVCSKQNDPQAQGSGISYARRYGLQAFLNIGAEDDDGERNYNRSAPAAAAPKPAPAPVAKAAPVAPAAVESPKSDRQAILDAITSNSKVLVTRKIVTVDQLKQALVSDFGVKTKEELTDEQAATLLETLKGKLNVQQ